MVKINPGETVTAPTAISGPSTGTVGASYSFTASGSTSSLLHAVEYQFDWGDGSVSAWSSSSQSHAWATANATPYSIKAKARCVPDHVESGWSILSSDHDIQHPTHNLYPDRHPLSVQVRFGDVISSQGDLIRQAHRWQITAMPAFGHTFTGWSGDATGTTTGAANQITISMPSSNATVTANFQ